MLSQLYASKLNVKAVQKVNKPKFHPYTHLLNSQPAKQHKSSQEMNNKLLVILVNFQEEAVDDALTTGNGSFQLVEDPEYRGSVGSPPHDQTYFAANLEALRYYYLAASHGLFNLEYDIYPQNQTAYTLPKPMRYYNPPNATSSLFISRVEEYFKIAFETADSVDDEIDFSQYGHFMIIHAGSDWQHDTKSDTPCDLPSFFIKVGDGKEAIVDNGNVKISKACNVPETISQDFDTSIIDEVTYYTGYGALNGVMAHEFGHSLGLVDLYNTYNFSPMVGQFDIMDSGGGFITEDWLVPGVLVEGMLPCLPGAYSRELMFGDLFKQNGLMVELEQFIGMHDINDILRIAASSMKQSSTTIVPNIFKIPINEYEYLLLENRSVDPDNDGGTVLVDALSGRVVLHPTPASDPLDLPSYEYDYLLPSFVDADYRAIGGGLLVWHIDNRVLYQMGNVNADGIFVSNFDANIVNTNYYHRGVRIVEADGLNDLGNVNSYYWTGTPFEYFHKFRPELGQNGAFISWTQQEWKPNLNATSNPALLDNQSHPSFYGLKDISQPSAIMTLRLTSGCFDTINKLGNNDINQIALPIINSNLSENVLPVLRDDTLHFYFYDPGMGIIDWSELIPPIVIGNSPIIYEPIISDYNNDGYKELVLTHSDKLSIIEINSDIATLTTVNSPQDETISCSPIYTIGKLFLATSNTLYQVNNTPNHELNTIISIANITRLSSTNSHLVIQTQNGLLSLPYHSNPGDIKSIDLPEVIGQYEPIFINDSTTTLNMLVLVSNQGNIYKYSGDKVERIYHNTNVTLPTNIAVASINNITPVIAYANNNTFYVIKTDGTLLHGFPKTYDEYTFLPHSHIKVRKLNDASTTTLFYIELTNGGYIAINQNGEVDRFNSIVDIKLGTHNQTFWLANEDKLYWFFTTNSGMLLSASIRNQTEQPFIWHGFRNNNNGVINLAFSEPSAISSKISINVFPSPVKSSLAYLRVHNPQGLINVNIYDISGNLVFKNSFSATSVAYKDIQLNLSGFSSGVYLVTVENNKQITKTKFAVQL